MKLWNLGTSLNHEPEPRTENSSSTVAQWYHSEARGFVMFWQCPKIPLYSPVGLTFPRGVFVPGAPVWGRDGEVGGVVVGFTHTM